MLAPSVLVTPVIHRAARGARQLYVEMVMHVQGRHPIVLGRIHDLRGTVVTTDHAMPDVEDMVTHPGGTPAAHNWLLGRYAQWASTHDGPPGAAVRPSPGGLPTEGGHFDTREVRGTGGVPTGEATVHFTQGGLLEAMPLGTIHAPNGSGTPPFTARHGGGVTHHHTAERALWEIIAHTAAIAARVRR